MQNELPITLTVYLQCPLNAVKYCTGALATSLILYGFHFLRHGKVKYWT